MTNILVTYASKHHSTAEIAEAIKEVLQAADGFAVDLQPVDAVEDISDYDAVVLGSAVYAGQWQATAAEFLKHNEQVLAQRPVWLFSSGPAGQGDPKTLMDGWTFPETLKPIAARIRPRDVTVFHGKLDPATLNLFERGIIKVVGAQMGDYRDWDSIRAWAADIARAL